MDQPKMQDNQQKNLQEAPKEKLADLSELSEAQENLEIYVHIPFCVRKCLYCDFFSGAYPENVQKEYFQHLLEEIRSCQETGRVSSVFFGGGTPTSVAPHYIGEILTALREKFIFLQDCEITLEGNPGTVSLESLQAYRASGVNRMSFGVQSGNDEALRKLGRIHTFHQAEEAVGLARKAGFQNLNLDVISGLPGESKEAFMEGFQKILALGPEHLSVYSLIIEEGTPFYTLYNEKNGTRKEEMPDEDEDRELVAWVNQTLKAAGYDHYEISNYARLGFECRHNNGYWTGVPYLGFGPGAASYVHGTRFKHALNLHWYEEPLLETEVLTQEDQMEEFMILGLRRMEGVRDAVFQERFRESFFSHFEKAIRKGLDTGTLIREGDRIRLSSYGIDVSNAVLAEFLLDA